jgi:hypothetical protein
MGQHLGKDSWKGIATFGFVEMDFISLSVGIELTSLPFPKVGKWCRQALPATVPLRGWKDATQKCEGKRS